ncbi:hypothetical protein HBB16_20050 [Pseudonocardia sp. MCCB 268]|nr:hypothetical protein [Pseudonocardia cytotoxica]
MLPARAGSRPDPAEVVSGSTGVARRPGGLDPGDLVTRDRRGAAGSVRALRHWPLPGNGRDQHALPVTRRPPPAPVRLPVVRRAPRDRRRTRRAGAPASRTATGGRVRRRRRGGGGDPDPVRWRCRVPPRSRCSRRSPGCRPTRPGSGAVGGAGLGSRTRCRDPAGRGARLYRDVLHDGERWWPDRALRPAPAGRRSCRCTRTSPGRALKLTRAARPGRPAPRRRRWLEVLRWPDRDTHRRRGALRQ